LPTGKLLSKVILGWATVAVNDVNCVGVVKPAGVEAEISVDPCALGVNCVKPLSLPPVTVTGEVVIVPTVVLALVTLTNTEGPPARAC
jgi:hypothetical protein